MSATLQGVYREGRIELLESPGDLAEETRVIVTVLPTRPADLALLGTDRQTAFETRVALSTFEDDWSTPDMDDYDDYAAAHNRLDAR